MSTFLDNNGGPGVQHIAFHTDDIISTTAQLRKRGLPVIQPPIEYYSLPVRACTCVGALPCTCMSVCIHVLHHPLCNVSLLSVDSFND